MGNFWYLSRVSTHYSGYPSEVLDWVEPNGEHLGCPHLSEAIKDLSKLQVHCFGHIHSAHGKMQMNSYTAYNSSLLDERYHQVFEPQIFEVKKPHE